MKTIQYGFYLLLLGCLFMSFRATTWVTHKADINDDSVTLDGHAVPANALLMNSRGVLAVAERDPNSSDRKAVPFRLLLNRAGMIIQRWPACNGQTNYSIRLDELWPVARPGDQLIIEPAGTPQRRIIYPIRVQTINWLPLLKSESGC